MSDRAGSATSTFLAVGDGYVSPRHMCLAERSAAVTPKSTQGIIPFSVDIAPFSDDADAESTVKVVDFTQNDTEAPLQYKNCKAYANTRFKLNSNENVFMCNMCGSDVSFSSFLHYEPLNDSVDYIISEDDFSGSKPQPNV